MCAWERKKGLGLNYYMVERAGSLEQSSGIPKGPELWIDPIEVTDATLVFCQK